MSSICTSFATILAFGEDKPAVDGINDSDVDGVDGVDGAVDTAGAADRSAMGRIDCTGDCASWYIRL